MKCLYLKNLDTFMYILMGLKKYEIRKNSNFINTLQNGDVIRIYCQTFSILCRIEKIIDFPSLRHVFYDNIDHVDIIPHSTSIDSAMSKYNDYYKNCGNCSFKALKLDICTV